MGAEQTGWLWNELAGSCPSPLERAASQSRHCDGSAFWLLTTQLRHRSVCLVIEEADVRRHLCPTERSSWRLIPFVW